LSLYNLPGKGAELSDISSTKMFPFQGTNFFLWAEKCPIYLEEILFKLLYALII